MEVLLIIVLLGAAAAGVVWYLRRRQAQEDARSAEQQTPPDPFAQIHGNEDLLYGLRVSDVLAYETRDYLVRGSLRFDDGGYSWAEHLIADGRTQHWLGVEDDEGISVTLWQRVPAAEVDGEPGAATVNLRGVTYQLHEQGDAAFTAEGTTGAPPSGTARYADYRGPAGQLLSFERFASTWEVSTGETVTPGAFDIYPRER